MALDLGIRRKVPALAENPPDIQMRLIALIQSMLFDPAAAPLFFIRNAFKISAMKDALLKEIERIGGEFGLIVVDTGPSFFETEDASKSMEALKHAKMFRELIDLIPGRPAIIVLCHPTKWAKEDELIPSGGGTFLNEIDGNLAVSKNDTAADLHWQGKWRGIEFAPLHFRLNPVTPSALADRNGRRLSTVIAEWISEETKEHLEEAGFKDRNRVLELISQNLKISYAQIAVHMGWPNKQRAERFVKNHMVHRNIIKRNEIDGGWKIADLGNKILQSINPK